ncbi:histidinol phosphate phosphatase [Clostridium beijerinckii]|uniref:D,D-heptose 1,7-bisphosphate phosphatase n=1 Tax=Clostridium beijerinckii TaxID=1520 RepID=A0AB74VJ51_CLOBE|nr:D-glycero-beta-D-manno-heptose 1,7-bisphosphate 7-phosphatase [Clostridium beijerinckii]NRZ25590.1 D-glycero-D-manno-heptose 1,7-bisphosphate phosphatase [Clostridium beijerinckii]NYB98105.1 D-glycero-D-manno-heptose 1,7-bisphosphate phosphatase [Clostridium beijerinckii]OOM23279.1 D-glycero-beta-D-manno-heptose-1,7-bisphosphate 7-phosphatase [Clostridium beijerinckii]QUN36345.1 D-glycero-beta-D-manno-heptose 1,7-bisphosphate 7-phosphatase [Clostridium beijerinckii]SQB12947.1 histidinol-pho
MKIVIMAGGKGTRIASINSEVPKPMIPILNKPILEYQMECFRNQGFTDIILVVGHLGSVIKDYFGDGSKISSATGKSFGVHIKYVEEKEPLGTAGALYLLKEKLTEDFLLVNGDIIFDVDIKKFYKFHKDKGGSATLFTHPNNHPYDSGIIVADSNEKVINWLHKEDKRFWYKNRVNAGLHMFSVNILKTFKDLKKMDLDREVLKPLISSGELFVYDSPEYVKDMGTPDRFYSVIEDIKTGKVKGKNLLHKQRAVFLDRDGTINRYVGFLKNIDDLELIDGVDEAIKKINEKGYLAIVVTNQPVIARGEVSIQELEEIHNKMETLLGESGAYIDDIFFCPHHPDKGFDGEKTEYKIICDCRKPEPGMLLSAAKKYNIDLSKSWMVGDSESDMKAGISAGCNVVLIGKSDIYTNYETLNKFVDNI